ncbi:MAG TPA: Type 1 glutamine amidotransferase-like domain-containing protein [Chloroflexota bacterium]|nr:Type 1 glutamine amidotransferase-like domain-containing protein [Chloroflexota bacterium]
MLAPDRGTVALVGSGEFLPAMDPVDRALLEGLADAPRVAVVPTAAAPDGDAVFERWLTMGVQHFTRLGVQAEPVPLRTRADADDLDLAATLARSNFVYLSGGKPSYLREALQGSACWEAIVGVVARGGVVAGCSAGAMVLGGALFNFRRSPLHPVAPALGLVPEIMVIPHFDEFPVDPGPFLGHVADGVTVVGVDGTTALVRARGEWTVLGRGGVTVFAGKNRLRYLAGQMVSL